MFTPNVQTKQHYQNIILSTDSIGVSVKKLVPRLEIVCNNIEIGTQVIPSIVKNTSGGRVRFQYKRVGSDDVTYTSVAPKQPGSYTVKAYLEETEEYLSATVTKDFEIKRKSISALTGTFAATSYTYTGEAIKPTVTVKNGATTLKNGTDYTVTYSNNIGAGTGMAIITGIGNYSGKLNKTFTIVRKSISALTGTLSATSYTYSGGAMKPTVTVKNGTTVLKNGTDYTVTYTGNINVGTGKVTITGIGNYSGLITKTFLIKPATVKATVIAGTKSATVKWTKTSGITGYIVYMSTSKNGTYTALKDVSSTTTSYKKTSLTKGKTYYFKVRAYKKSGTSYLYGDYSSIVSVKVK